MKISPFLPSARLIVLAIAALGASAQAESIVGINFAGSQNNATYKVMNLDQVSGLVAAGNWNNVYPTATNSFGVGTIANVNDAAKLPAGRTQPTAGTLVFSDGIASTLTYSHSGNGNWSYNNGTSYAGTDALQSQQQLYNGLFLDTTGTNPTVTVGNLNASGFTLYSVYVYISGNANNTGTISDGTTTFSTIVSGQIPGSAGYTLATDTVAGNYVVFQNLTADSFTLTVDRTGAGSNYGINGIQIVGVPEPSTVALIGVGLAFGGLRLRRAWKAARS